MPRVLCRADIVLVIATGLTFCRASARLKNQFASRRSVLTRPLLNESTKALSVGIWGLLKSGMVLICPQIEILRDKLGNFVDVDAPRPTK